MRQFTTRILPAVMAVLGLGLLAFLPRKKEMAIPPANNGFALLELFTSEGCSSCPPADALAAEIQKESQDKPVYVLAYHVDYWDHQGWKDGFSKAAFSQRQKDYSNWLGTNEVYTPQVVINGAKQLVGSDESGVRSAVGKALAERAKASVRLTVAGATAGAGSAGADSAGSGSAGAGSAGSTSAGAGSAGALSLSVGYRVDGAAPADELLVAVVEKSAVRKIGGGENGGRTLSHVQIVRELQKVDLPATGTGTVSVNMPAGFDDKNWEVVGFLQNTKTGMIEAASKAGITRAGSVGSVTATPAVTTTPGVTAAVKNVVIVHGAFADASGILPPDENGIVYFDKQLFHDYFAADLPKAKSDFMADAQQPIAAVCFGAPVTQAAWKTKPSYAIVATEDKAINPELERVMYKHAGATVTELKSCHVVFMSQPAAVAAVIETAAGAASK